MDAVKHLKTASHILGVTYPLLKDTKLLLGVMDSIFLAMTKAMGAILEHERMYKRIPPYGDNFESKFNMFRARCVTRLGVDIEIVKAMQEVKEIVTLHRKSPVEFRRKDSFVICSRYYNLKVITAVQIKEYLKKATKLVEIMLKLLKNERLPRGSEGRIEAC